MEQHEHWIARVMQSQSKMSHALEGSEIGALLHKSNHKDKQLATAVREMTALNNVIIAQQKQIQQQQHEYNELRKALEQSIERKFSALKAVSPAGPTDLESSHGLRETGVCQPRLSRDLDLDTPFSGKSPYDPSSWLLSFTPQSFSFTPPLSPHAAPAAAAASDMGPFESTSENSARRDTESSAMNTGDTSAWSICDAPPSDTHAPLRKEGATVGLKLEGLAVADMIVGGPAHQCGMVEVGDVIVDVNDIKIAHVAQALQELKGTDIPGSILHLGIRKRGRGSLRRVSIQRVSCESLAKQPWLSQLDAVQYSRHSSTFCSVCGNDLTGSRFSLPPSLPPSFPPSPRLLSFFLSLSLYAYMACNTKYK
jgi:hypothetical protein